MAWWLEDAISRHFGWVRNPSEAFFFQEKLSGFFTEIFLNDFSIDFSSPLQPITEKSADFSDFLFPG